MSGYEDLEKAEKARRTKSICTMLCEFAKELEVVHTKNAAKAIFNNLCRYFYDHAENWSEEEKQHYRDAVEYSLKNYDIKDDQDSKGEDNVQPHVRLY